MTDHDAKEREAESEDHAATVTGDRCPDCGDKMEYVGTPDGSGGYLHCWRCWYRDHPESAPFVVDEEMLDRFDLQGAMDEELSLGGDASTLIVTVRDWLRGEGL